MSLTQVLDRKLHQEPMFIDGIMNSIGVVDHLKTSFVKVVQNYFLVQDLRVNYREALVGAA